MDKFYSVFEIQATGESISPLEPIVYEDQNQSLSKYFLVLSSAVVSNLDYHRAFIIRDDGVITEGRVFGKDVDSVPDFYTVIEVQILDNTPVVVTPIEIYTDVEQAKGAFHSKCASAAAGSAEYNAIYIVDKNNIVIENGREIFDRRIELESEEIEPVVAKSGI